MRDEGGVIVQQAAASPFGHGVAITHILVVTDPARSRDFWAGVLGAELYREYGGTSVVLRFAGTCAPGPSAARDR